MHSCLGSDPRQLESDVAYANAMTLNTRPDQVNKCSDVDACQKKWKETCHHVGVFLVYFWSQ
jgi:hypothetical protein